MLSRSEVSMSQCLSHSSLRTQQCPGRSLNVSIVSKAIPASDNVRAEVSMSQCLKAIPAVPASEPNYARAEVSMSQCLIAIPAFELRSPTMPRVPGRSLNVSSRSLIVSMSQEPSQPPSPAQPLFRLRSLASPTMPRESNYASRAQLCLASPTMPRNNASRAQLRPLRAELCLRRTVCKQS